MAQQHDLPPAYLRMWWRVPTWTRMLPVVCGSLLAPMALMSISTQAPSHSVPDMAIPAPPNAAPQTSSSPAPESTTTIRATATSTVQVPAPSPQAPAAPKTVTQHQPPLSQPPVAAPAVVHSGSPCSYQGQTAAYADSGPALCAVTEDGSLRWRKS